MLSEDWRIKGYYDKRILIGIANVLECTFPDSLLCLSGGELVLLRTLLDYADRRSTWVSEYRDTDYVAPDDDEWDAIQDFVSGLEEKLMGCTELEEILAAIQAAAECACEAANALKGMQWPSGANLPEQPDYDNRDSTVQYQSGDPPGELADWDDWLEYKCIAAQILVDDLIDLYTNLEQYAEEIGAPVFAVIQTFLTASLAGIPLAVALLVAEFLIVHVADFVWDETIEWLQQNKQGFVCAIYAANTSAGAKAALDTYIDTEWDKLWLNWIVHWLFTRNSLAQIFDAELPTYDDQSGNYSATYCESCDLPLFPGSYTWQWSDACPKDWTLAGGANCTGGPYWPQVYVQDGGTSQTAKSPWLAVPAGTYDVQATDDVRTSLGLGGNMIYMEIWRSYLEDHSDATLIQSFLAQSPGADGSFHDVLATQFAATWTSDGYIRVGVRSPTGGTPTNWTWHDSYTLELS
jgi:hypothetical protein